MSTESMKKSALLAASIHVCTVCVASPILVQAGSIYEVMRRSRGLGNPIARPALQRHSDRLSQVYHVADRNKDWLYSFSRSQDGADGSAFQLQRGIITHFRADLVMRPAEPALRADTAREPCRGHSSCRARAERLPTMSVLPGRMVKWLGPAPSGSRDDRGLAGRPRVPRMGLTPISRGGGVCRLA